MLPQGVQRGVSTTGIQTEQLPQPTRLPKAGFCFMVVKNWLSRCHPPNKPRNNAQDCCPGHSSIAPSQEEREDGGRLGWWWCQPTEGMDPWSWKTQEGQVLIGASWWCPISEVRLPRGCRDWHNALRCPKVWLRGVGPQARRQELGGWGGPLARRQ